MLNASLVTLLIIIFVKVRAYLARLMTLGWILSLLVIRFAIRLKRGKSNEYFRIIKCNEELKAVYRFITTCNTVELLSIVEEIRCYHDNLFTWNEDSRLFAKVESVCLNGECIQLNIEKDVSDE